MADTESDFASYATGKDLVVVLNASTSMMRAVSRALSPVARCVFETSVDDAMKFMRQQDMVGHPTHTLIAVQDYTKPGGFYKAEELERLMYELRQDSRLHPQTCLITRGAVPLSATVAGYKALGPETKAQFQHAVSITHPAKLAGALTGKLSIMQKGQGRA